MFMALLSLMTVDKWQEQISDCFCPTCHDSHSDAMESPRYFTPRQIILDNIVDKSLIFDPMSYCLQTPFC